MKKNMYLSFVLLMAMGLTACNQQQEEKEKVSVTESVEKGEANKKETNAEAPVVKEELTTNPDESVSNNQEELVYQNKVFKDVIVMETEEKIVVTGKAQVFEGNFQYKLYEGDKVFLENYYQTDGAPAWGEFEIEMEKELTTHDNVRFELFVYSAKDGSKENVLEIPVQK